MADPLDGLKDSSQQEQLRAIRDLFGQVVAARELRERVPGFHVQRGIYKPAQTPYALWVRETLHGPYDDEAVQFHPDGSWTYRYAPEARGGVPDLRLATNAGLLRCRDDKVPVGVFRQTRRTGGVSEYEVLGLAYVREYDGTHFVLAGEPIDWTEAPAMEAVTPIFKPFEVAPQRLGPALRVVRDRRFGEVIRRIYDWRCSLCNVGYRLRGRGVGTEAAHIIPVEANGVIGDVRNGLLLCQNHHALFDRHGWTIDEDLRVTVAPDDDFRQSAKENHILAWEGKRLPNLPAREEDLPAAEVVRWRLDAFEKAWGR